jgi:hypothetical protein
MKDMIDDEQDDDDDDDDDRDKEWKIMIAFEAVVIVRCSCIKQ